MKNRLEPLRLNTTARCASRAENPFYITQNMLLPAATEQAEPPLTPDEAALYARFFQVLSDPTRVRLLHLLLDAPDAGRTVSELVESIGAPQSRISTHLGCLRWCGLVQTTRAGKQVYYRIADPRVRKLLAPGGAMIRD